MSCSGARAGAVGGAEAQVNGNGIGNGNADGPIGRLSAMINAKLRWLPAGALPCRHVQPTWTAAAYHDSEELPTNRDSIWLLTTSLDLCPCRCLQPGGRHAARPHAAQPGHRGLGRCFHRLRRLVKAERQSAPWAWVEGASWALSPGGSAGWGRVERVGRVFQPRFVSDCGAADWEAAAVCRPAARMHGRTSDAMHPAACDGRSVHSLHHLDSFG